MSKITDIVADLRNIETTTGAVQAALDGKVDDGQVLTNVPAGALFTDTVYTHPTTSGNKHIPSGGSTGQILTWSTDGTAVWGAAPAGTGTVTNVTGTAPISVANGTTTPSISMAAATFNTNGYMTSTYASKLDGIQAGATAYVHPTTSGNKHIPAGGTTSQVLTWSSDGTAVWSASSGGAALTNTVGGSIVGASSVIGISGEAARADHGHSQASYGTVGSFAFAWSNTACAPGANVAGSALQAFGMFVIVNTAGLKSGDISGFAFSGTWHCLGYAAGGTQSAPVSATATLFLRVA